MKLQEKKPALILIDIQKEFLDEKLWEGIGTIKLMKKSVEKFRKMESIKFTHIEFATVCSSEKLIYEI